jgi:hypothetical protein
MVAQVGYSVIGRSSGRVTSCVVCTMHVKMRSMSFLVEPQNQCGEGFSGLGLKTGSYGLVIWASKSPRWLSRLQFVGCASKLTGGCNCMGEASRFSGLLRVEASRVRVSRFALKLAEVR